MSKACSCTFALLPLAILIGLGIGHFLPASGKTLDALIDPLVLGILALIFFEVRFAPQRHIHPGMSGLEVLRAVDAGLARAEQESGGTRW